MKYEIEKETRTIYRVGKFELDSKAEARRMALVLGFRDHILETQGFTDKNHQPETYRQLHYWADRIGEILAENDPQILTLLLQRATKTS